MKGCKGKARLSNSQPSSATLTANKARNECYVANNEQIQSKTLQCPSSPLFKEGRETMLWGSTGHRSPQPPAQHKMIRTEIQGTGANVVAVHHNTKRAKE